MTVCRRHESKGTTWSPEGAGTALGSPVPTAAPFPGEYNGTLMFLAPGNMPKFAPIAERHPNLPLIIDHMSLTAEIAKEKKVKEAIDAVVALAKYPNVSVKLSSAPLFSSEPYPFRDMTAHIRRLFDAYGPRRCYWGTDVTIHSSRPPTVSA